MYYVLREYEIELDYYFFLIDKEGYQKITSNCIKI